MKVEVNEVTKRRIIEQVGRMKASENAHRRVVADANDLVTTMIEASVPDEDYDPDTLKGIDLNTVQEGYVTLEFKPVPVPEPVP